MSNMINFFRGKPKPSLLPEPSTPIVGALDAELHKDTKFIGEVFRQLSKGVTPDEIAKEAGHKNSKNVISFEYAIRGLRGDTPAKNVKFQSRDQMGFAAERLLASTDNAELKEYLQGKLSEIQKPPSRPKSETVSQTAPIPVQLPTGAQSQADTSTAGIGKPEAESRPGVYVYSYPQYLSMEAVSPDGRAFYKIGASGSIADRVERQGRQTEVPEDLVLVRAFYSDEPFELEKKFHNILKAANMHQKTTQGGVEWFSCNLAMIDAIAEAVRC